MIVELNIGLNVADNTRNGQYARDDRADLALATVRTLGNVLAHRRAMSSTEDTLIVRMSVGGMARLRGGIYELAELLQQDCIAIWNATDWSGELVGPNATAWGEFNPEFFLTFREGGRAVVLAKSAETQDLLAVRIAAKRYAESLNTDELAAELAPKSEVRYTGHGANTGGLQGHSIGDEYPYLVHGVADRWEAPTEYVVMDTRTGNRSQRFPTYMAAYIHLTSLKVRNCMHG